MIGEGAVKIFLFRGKVAFDLVDATYLADTKEFIRDDSSIISIDILMELLEGLWEGNVLIILIDKRADGRLLRGFCFCVNVGFQNVNQVEDHILGI